MPRIKNRIFFTKNTFEIQYRGWKRANKIDKDAIAYDTIAKELTKLNLQVYDTNRTISSSTIKSWRFPTKGYNVTYADNLSALQEMFHGCLKVFKTEEEVKLHMNNDIHNRVCKIKAYNDTERMLAVEVLSKIDSYLNYIVESCLELNVEDISYKYEQLYKEIQPKLFFLPTEIEEIINKLMHELLETTENETYKKEFSSEVGVETEEGFLVNDILLMMQIHEEITNYYINLVNHAKQVIKNEMFN